jgi:hypothetical protein
MWTTLDPVHDEVVIRASLNLHMTFIIHAIFNSFLILDLMILFGFDFPPLYLKLNFGPHGTSPIYNEIFVCTNINLHITILMYKADLIIISLKIILFSPCKTIEANRTKNLTWMLRILYGSVHAKKYKSWSFIVLAQ